MSPLEWFRAQNRGLIGIIVAGVISVFIFFGAGELLWHSKRGSKPDAGEAARIYLQECGEDHSARTCTRIEQTHHSNCWEGSLTYRQCGPGGGYCQDLDFDNYLDCMRRHEPTEAKAQE
jgi:hypothetical protein